VTAGDRLRHGHVVRALAEARLGVVLFADASRIDLGALRREAAVPAPLLGIGLPLTIVAGALVAVALLGELTLLEAACSRSCSRRRTPPSVRRS